LPLLALSFSQCLSGFPQLSRLFRAFRYIVRLQRAPR
jgi:hypothetical protein